VKRAFPRPHSSAGPSLSVNFRGSRVATLVRCERPTVLPSPRGEHEAQASKMSGSTRRNGFSWVRARVSRSRSDASRSWRSGVARQAEYARSSSEELHGNAPDGGHEARTSESVQSTFTVVPKTACFARSARASVTFYGELRFVLWSVGTASMAWKPAACERVGAD